MCALYLALEGVMMHGKQTETGHKEVVRLKTKEVDAVPKPTDDPVVITVSPSAGIWKKFGAGSRIDEANEKPLQLGKGVKSLELGKVVTLQIVGPDAGELRARLSKLSTVGDGLSRLIESVAESDVSAETVDLMLHEVADSVARRRPGSGALTQAEADFLTASGAYTDEALAALEKRVDEGELAGRERETRLGVIARSLTTREVSDLLGIDTSRVRHRLSDNHLFAFRAGKARQYPRWQFLEGGKVLPNLPAVVPAFPAQWQPASIEGFMTTPQRDLSAGSADGSADEVHLSPAEWLAGGGDPAEVVAILDRIASA